MAIFPRHVAFRKDNTKKRNSNSWGCFVLGILGLAGIFMLLLNSRLLSDFQQENYSSVLLHQRSIFDRKGLPKAEVQFTEEDDVFTITHVFNTYLPDTAELMFQVENEVVQGSWANASNFAVESGIFVEFVCAVFEEDISSCPHFSRPVILTKSVFDPIKKKKLPTIGEIFSVGKEKGEGEYILYTNADIGFTKNLYNRLRSMLELDNREPEVIREMTLEAFEFLYYCLNYNYDETYPENFELCRADLKMFFVLHGGHDKVYPQVRHAIARLYTRNKTIAATESGMVPTEAEIRGWFLVAGGEESDIDFTLEEASEYTIDNFYPDVSRIARQFSAITLTRRDFQVSLKIRRKPSVDKLMKLVEGKDSFSHPGNDFFVMPISMVPQSILDSSHPLAWRPWGSWITHSFEWEYEGKLVWRHFGGHKDNLYTFHFGISGSVAQHWKDIAVKEPAFVLNHAADWNQATKGRYVQLFDTPSYCTLKPIFAGSTNFCLEESDTGIPKPNIDLCMGRQRFTCSRYRYAQSNEGNIYSSLCSIFTSGSDAVPPYLPTEAQCKFCLPLEIARNDLNPELKAMCENASVST